ncbi:MAG: class I SAM-dependent methyltransferase [Butyrivibrio sp.]|nr:class I SAM-dependent methyltransferase [Butyrivibrio sp.]
MEKVDKIGKVNLNFEHYKGMDLYCDGDVEDVLLDIVKNHSKEEYPDIIEKSANWPILYHLSEQRSNIVEWIPMTHTEKVLEVGSGCGAITGELARKSASLTCVDLSKKRSEINAWRNRTCDNVTIHVGNFRDIEPDLDTDYNYIFLIGVFEYGQGYIGGEHPYENFLNMLKGHLAKGGRIVIAIENRTGLKYFAGSREDHLGTYFTGIEGYPEDSVARTFTRNGLIQIFQKCGMQEYQFYYPYPDYKLMTMLHSDHYMPKLGELFDNVRNYDRDRMTLFNEKYAYDGLIQDEMYPEFANSFEVILGPPFPVAYCKYSNDRADEFKVRTDISTDKAGRKVIRKYPLTEAAKEHIVNIRDAYLALVERFKGGDLEINDCQIAEGTSVATFSYVNGVPLSALMDKCLAADDMEGFQKLFQEYLRRISYRDDYPVADYDLIFPNIIVNGPIWTVIDYEWTYGKTISSREIAFRALYCYIQEDKKRTKLDVDKMYRLLQLSSENIAVLLEEEAAFQKYVTGKHSSMVELWKMIGQKNRIPKELRAEDPHNVIVDRIQIYRDYGEGYTEECSEYAASEYDQSGSVTVVISVDRDAKAVRIDPAFTTCVVTLKEVLWNEVSITENDTAVTIHPNGAWLSDDSIVFDTEDPGIEFGLDDENLKRTEQDQLTVTMIMSPVAGTIAKNLADYQIEDMENTVADTERTSSLAQQIQKIFRR